MQDEILNIKNEAISQIMEAGTKDELELIRVNYLGRKGKINTLIKKIKETPKDQRKNLGILINETKEAIEDAIRQKIKKLIAKEEKLEFDLTIPGLMPSIGNLHPQTKILERVKKIFTFLGYQVADGPEIENDYYNFQSLNIPKEHPARDMQMTLYLDTGKTKLTPGEILLRTQTSAMQVRVMEKTNPPFRVLVPGKNFRFEQVDASHSFEFWQVEGFAVDKDIHLTDLFGTIDYVLRELFGEKIKIRFATTNFPFVEPGVDTYIECSICSQKGCSFCKQTGWIEIMPAGMIHPFVLNQAKIDHKTWKGFAFAIGLSRLVNLVFRIDDLRVLTTPDIRILRQF